VVARKLSFHATRVEAEPGDGDAATLSFLVDADGDASTYFTLVADDEEDAVRVSWGDGKDARDECVVKLESAALALDKFRAEIAEPRPKAFGPYGSVELSFDTLEEDEASAAAGALVALAKHLGDKLTLTVPGVTVASVTSGSTQTAVPRRVGPPTLGVASKSTWRAKPASELALALTVSNIGGALEGGVMVEVAGPALEASLVAPTKLSGKGGEAVFEHRGKTASAHLPDLKMPADLDVDRRADKKAAKPPTTELTLSVVAHKAGSGLLTVRITPAGRRDRGGSALVGRTFVIED
ncbi:MAG: hypothetical protein K8H88_16785, partial [Sandaracinaceae bacterium]|nr:hypothetical protein [Sandaracinaceae bacterium]